jgi:hypothetical protein
VKKTTFEKIPLGSYFSAYGDYHGVSDAPIIFLFKKDIDYAGTVVAIIGAGGTVRDCSKRYGGGYCFNCGDDVWEEVKPESIE